jgi:hypothetical protein
MTDIMISQNIALSSLDILYNIKVMTDVFVYSILYSCLRSVNMLRDSSVLWNIVNLK